MDTLPQSFSQLLEHFTPAFTRPTFRRFCLLLLAAIMTIGARTVSNLLRTLDFFYFSIWRLSKILIEFILKHYYPNKKIHRRHRTPSEILQALMSILLKWYPERRFQLALDSGCVSYYFAQFAHQHHPHLTLISKCHPRANLYKAPQALKGAGRPRVKGQKQKNPEQVVQQTPAKSRKKLIIHWYGGEKRKIEIVEGRGLWYKAGQRLIPIKWVFVHDLTGTHRDEYFFSTDPFLTSQSIIEAYTGRWSIEVTFEEVRAYVGLGTTRARVQNAVTREAPCLFGLFSLIALMFDQLPKKYKHNFIVWNGKKNITFSDAITAVRRFLWVEWIFETLHFKQTFQKFPQKLQRMLLYNLAPTR